MEAATTQRETARDEQSRVQLQQTEDRLQEEINKLQAKSSEMVSWLLALLSSVKAKLNHVSESDISSWL